MSKNQKIFMTFGDVKGTGTEAGHKDWIEVHSFRFHIDKAVSQGAGSGTRNISTPSLSSITIEKHLDKASPDLFQEAVGGSGRNCVIHFLCGGDAGLKTYLEYTLENAVLAHYGVKHNGSDTPIEEIEISYTKMIGNHTPLDVAGKPSNPRSFGYDLVQAKKL